MKTELVSIITPSYNSSKYIKETMNCVIAQTYKNWEMLIADDCSSDDTRNIVEEYTEKDKRIKLIKLENNGGAAIARNTALGKASGRYIAYLDADDLWFPQKLEKQLKFLNENNAEFSCPDYEKIEDDGTPLNKIVTMPKTISYKQLLRNTVIQTSGVIVDLKTVDKKLLEMPNVRRGQDSATWFQMLRNGVVFKGQNETLSIYRRVPQSLSSNKFVAMKRTWYLYRNVEKLSLPKSLYCLLGWGFNASLRRIYLKK